jgi:hypothetical protein
MFDFKAESVEYNWRQVACGMDDMGEDYDFYIVGNKGVSEIIYHKPQGEGDRHFCKVMFEDGKEEIVFNLNRVVMLGGETQ